MKKILLLPGDGIGPEVAAEAEKVLSALDCGIEFERALVGGAAIDDVGEPLPQATLSLAKSADAVLLGAVGAPQYDSLPPPQRPERGLLGLRLGLGLFANLRPAICHPSLADASPLKRELVEGLDILIVRELTGGIYFGEPRGIFPSEHEGGGGGRVGVNTLRYSEDEIARVARVAFESARRRRRNLCSVDKANVLESSILWREVVSRIADDYSDVSLWHLYVDNAAMQLARDPRQFDVVLAGNLFGDILSDEAATLTGSIGMLPSASLGESGGGGIFEPVHGSAPDIAGKNSANPLAMILSAAMMMRHSFSDEQNALRIESAVSAVLDDGFRTPDIASEGGGGGDQKIVGAREMGDAVVTHLR